MVLWGMAAIGGGVLGAGLINPGFEAGDLGGWGLTGTGTTYVISTTFPHSGSYCVLGVRADGGLGGLIQNFPMIGGATYEASIWYRALGTHWTWGSSYADSTLVEFDKSRNVVAYNNIALLGLTYPVPVANWTRATKEFTSGNATTSAQIYVNGQVLEGDQLFVDDFSVKMKPTRTLAAANRAVRDDIMGDVAPDYSWLLWGEAGVIDSGNLSIDDGSGASVRVIAPNHTIADGDYISAKGTLDMTTGNPILNGQEITTLKRALKTFNARDYGAVPNTAADAGPGIRAAIAAAAATGVNSEVVLESGAYRVKTLQDGRFHLVINGSRHLTIRGVAGATQLVFTNPGNPAVGIFGCTDTFVKDIIIDYDPVPFTQGTVVAIDKAAGTFDLNLDAGYPVLSQPWFQPNGMGEIIDRSKRRLKTAAPDYAFVESWSLVQNRLWRMKFDPSTADRLNYMAAGDAYVHLARLPGGTIEMNSCTDCGLENLVEYASPGLSLLLAGSETPTILNAFQIRFKPGSNRLIASNGDGVHCQQNRQGPKLDGCYFEGLCDDGVNVYCPPNTVQGVRSSTQIVVGQNTGIRVGDLVQVFDLENGAIRAEVNVTAVQTEGSSYVITLSAPVSGVRSSDPADHVYNLSACGAGFVVKNSTFRNHRRNGLTIRGINGLVEGNTFDHTCGFPINAVNEPGWPEGPIPRDLTFRGNTVLGGADSLGYSSDTYSAAFRVFSLKNSGFTNDRVCRRITVENNTFTDPPKACVFLGSVQDGSVRNNTANTANPFVLQQNCAGVVEENNTVTAGAAGAGR